MTGQPAPGSVSTFFFDVASLNVSDPGNPSTFVIEASSPWSVQISLAFSGPGAAWLIGLPLTLAYQLRAESMGPGAEVILGTDVFNTNPGQLMYGPGNPAHIPNINVAANTLPAGAYKLVATVTSTAGGGPPPGIAGYVEGPILQII